MFRLINGVTVIARVCPSRKPQPPSPFLISPSTSRSIHIAPGYLARSIKTRRKMAQVLPKTRPRSEVEADPDKILPSVQKKPRLDVELEENAVPSTSTATATTVTRGQEPAKKKKKIRRRLPDPYSNADVLWRDVRDFLGADVADGIIEKGNEWETPFQPRGEEELEVEVSALSSTGTPNSRFYPPPSIALVQFFR